MVVGRAHKPHKKTRTSNNNNQTTTTDLVAAGEPVLEHARDDLQLAAARGVAVRRVGLARRALQQIRVVADLAQDVDAGERAARALQDVLHVRAGEVRAVQLALLLFGWVLLGFVGFVGVDVLVWCGFAAF